MTATTSSTIEQLNALTIGDLVNLAECASPDSPTSAGATFLTDVRDAVADLFEEDAIDGLLEDRIFEIADNAPDIYTVGRWAEFIDLAAWNEDPQDVGGSTDMTDMAAQCLFAIAERLATRLLESAGVQVD